MEQKTVKLIYHKQTQSLRRATESVGQLPSPFNNSKSIDVGNSLYY